MENQSNLTIQDQEYEAVCMSELFGGLHGHACWDHSKLIMHLEFACQNWVKASPASGEDAIHLMSVFTDMLCLLGRHNDLILSKYNYYTTLADHIEKLGMERIK